MPPFSQGFPSKSNFPPSSYTRAELTDTAKQDRTAIGLAKVGGMAADIQLTDQQYFLTVAVFQVGYVIAEIPSNMILSVTRPSLYIPAIMILWGAVSASLAAVQTPAQLIAVRFVLGIFEAGFSPAVLFLISTWYKKSEQ